MNRVLIIEDEINTARPVKEALELNGIEAVIASNGIDGLKQFDDSSFDLVLLDLKMPGMDGEEVLKEIRKSDPFVDVIIYTNYHEFTDIKKLTNIGIDGYINKGPKADLSELIKMIVDKLEPLDEEEIRILVKKTSDDFSE